MPELVYDNLPKEIDSGDVTIRQCTQLFLHCYQSTVLMQQKSNQKFQLRDFVKMLSVLARRQPFFPFMVSPLRTPRVYLTCAYLNLATCSMLFQMKHTSQTLQKAVE